MYIAKKPCHLQGETFLIGQSIPDGKIDKSRVSALVKWGMIAVVDGEAPKATSKAVAEESKPAQSAYQPVQNAPEEAGEAEMDKIPAGNDEYLRKGKRGGRKKAEA